MQQQIQSHTTPVTETRPVPISPRDQQREALNSLLTLATQCASTEEQIEKHLHAAMEESDKAWENRQQEIGDHCAEQLKKLVLEHQHKREKIVAAYQSDVAKCREELTQAASKIKWEYDAADHKVRNQSEEAKWLAEGEVDTARNQIRAQTEELNKLLHDHKEALDVVEQSANNVLSRSLRRPPVMATPDCAAALAGQDLPAAMTAQLETSQQALTRLRRLLLPKLFFGATPWFFMILICATAAAVTYWLYGTNPAILKIIGIVVGATFVVALIAGVLVRKAAKTRLIETYKPLYQAMAMGRHAAQQHAEETTRRQEAYFAEAKAKALLELQHLKQKAAATVQAIQTKRDTQKNEAKAQYDSNMAAIESQRKHAGASADEALENHRQSLLKSKENDLAVAKGAHDHAIEESRRQHEESLASLKIRLSNGLAHSRAPGEFNANGNGEVTNEREINGSQISVNWTPSKTFPALLRFGDMEVDLKRSVDSGPARNAVKLQFPSAFKVPATLAFPYGASLLVQFDHSGRSRALSLIQTVMLRILTELPPGRVRFTIIDPVGLGQNFAGFMRLADYDEALVGGRIWTQGDQIEQRLSDLTEHMETVIQKYLRNEFATIDDYNVQAGELAEPYRFVVVADLPAGFERESFRRLVTIAATGARCGVYVLVAGDRKASASTVPIDELANHCVHVVEKDGAFKWKDEVFGQFPLSLDEPPSETVQTQLLDHIGKEAKASQHVEVSFDAIAPSPEEFWSLKSSDSLAVPIGRMGATRLQMMRLGKGMAQHALLAGKTGSGKSTLLHAIVTNVAMWYSPDEVELYLIDFKKGVEFKTYATHHLPHARAIAVESDREFGISVLERLDVELGRRGEIFRKAGVQDLPSYRRNPNAPIMPRTLLVIDEFQEFFSEDDKIAQQSGLLMDRLVRQGRAFGIHLLLGSQTIGGTSGLARSTIGQMAVRIALQVSEADSQIILGDNNSAARLLSRPGAAIYNDAGGLVEANSPFQVAWLPDEKREVYLKKISKLAAPNLSHRPAPVIFEGNAPADVNSNHQLAAVLKASKPDAVPGVATAWIGEPVAIKEPTSLTLRRQSGANVLLVGQQEEQSLSVMTWSLISLAAVYPQKAATFHVMDGTPADSPFAGMFKRIQPAVSQEIKLVEWRDIAETIHAVTEEVHRRLESEPVGSGDIYIYIYGLQRFRMLRKSEDDFSFSSRGDEEKTADPGKELVEIIRDGPAVGVYVVTWVDTVASLERTFERNSQREFDNRILFQMSAADSSTLIDSTVANNLGFYRALSCSEERGVMEKFRPYALPSAQWIEEHKAH